eukprot:TRINITY_DN4073_c0_g1_i1.p2 TRINITY_DN4073_c0_g1~~TRINITY_DN4073_c0_g1_i1.p2  ORF type:complete len:117 (-),score=2.91 TRINITY_DN4073_c0_g1_i1:201-551(-)
MDNRMPQVQAQAQATDTPTFAFAQPTTRGLLAQRFSDLDGAFASDVWMFFEPQRVGRKAAGRRQARLERSTRVYGRANISGDASSGRMSWARHNILNGLSSVQVECMRVGWACRNT